MHALSSQQQAILKWLISRIRHAEQHNPQQLNSGIYWAPRWKPKCNDQSEDKAQENAWRASLCRTLVRLEKRGLVSRVKGRKQLRTTT
jgi:hypothetical protein